MADRAARESRRARKGRKLSARSRNGGDECLTGHPALFVMEPAFELGTLPEGGGYPVGLVELVARLMGIDDLAAIVHLCSGSVRAPRTLDLRADVGAACVADVRWLPLRPGSCRWILADPPYGMDYAEEMWGLGRQYPTPRTLLRECAEALEPGGQVALLHHVVPSMVPGLERVGTWGVWCGAETRIRALTVARRTDPEEGRL